MNISSILMIVIAFSIASAAIYILYSIILFKGVKPKGEELQLSTKNILEQVAILFEKKEYALVELLASKYLDRVPSHTDVRIYLAKAFFEDKKYNLAIKHCETILRKKPNNIETHKVLAGCFEKKRMYNKAIEEYEFVAERDSKNKEVIRTLADLYNTTEQLSLAIQTYGHLADLITDEQEMADIQSIIAELNIEVHDFPSAFEAYKVRLGILPKDVDTNRKLAELYIQINNYPAAIDTLLYMLSFVLDPKVLLWIYEVLVDMYEESEEYEQAIEYAEKLLEVQGSDKFKVRDRISSFKIKSGKIDEGILILEDLAMLSQNGFDVTIELAAAYINKKEYEKALERYLILLDKSTPKEAKTINSLICEMYIAWAIDLREKNDLEDSYEKLKSAEQYNMINPEVYYNVAYNAFLQKNYTKTVESVSQAINYDKNNNYFSKNHLLLANAHEQLGHIFEQKKALSDLLNFDSKNAQGLYKIGMLFASQHDLKNAEESLKKAITYDPEYLEAKYNLALLYENNNKDKARELYMEILEQDPTFDNARSALADLSST